MTRLSILRSAIFAGICIGIAGFGFLSDRTMGMVFFIFGLATVVSYKLKLFTGTAGFVRSRKDIIDLCIILIGNWIGCLFVALAAQCSPMSLQDSAQHLLEGRLALGAWQAGVLSIGCGILMTTAVTFARKSNEFGHWLPLIMAVPLFILCGFPHCIADAFYYFACPVTFWADNLWQIVYLYFSIVIGNFIGCNLYRAFVKIPE